MNMFIDNKLHFKDVSIAWMLLTWGFLFCIFANKFAKLKT